MVTLSFKGQAQVFLPKSAFDTVTNKDVISRLISKDEDLYLNPQEEAELVTRVHQEGRKLFATCVYCDLPMTCLKALLDNGHTDAKVPLTLDDCPRERHKRKFVTGFLVHQKRFNTPYFAHESSQSLDDRVIPIWLDESRSNMRGKGAFGEVYPARIHRDHHSLSCVSMQYA